MKIRVLREASKTNSQIIWAPLNPSSVREFKHTMAEWMTTKKITTNEHIE